MIHFRMSLVGLAAATSILLAACGGSHTSTLLPSDHSLQPQLNGGPGNLAQPTLYVSGQGSVYAYDLGASGNAAPVSKSGGYYYQGPGGLGASIAGIATNTDGDLAVVQNVTSPQGGGNSCQVVLILARTSENINDTFRVAPCVNPGGRGTTPGKAIGVTYTGWPRKGIPDDIDVLMHYEPNGDPNLIGCYGTSQPQYQVNRYHVSAPYFRPVYCVPLPSRSGVVYHAIAGSTNGAYFLDASVAGGSDAVLRVDGYSFTNIGEIPGAGPLAVSANPATNVGHRVVASTVGGITTVYSFTMNSDGSMTFNHALGTFTNRVGALAVDNNGTIYVGVNQPNGVTKVKVYGPTKTQATDPDYVLNDPVRRPNPSASPAAAITGMAIAQ